MGRGYLAPETAAMSRSHRRVTARWLLLLALLVSGCEPESTPLPAFVVASPTPPPATPTRGPLRYGLTHESGQIPDLALLRAAAEVEFIDANADESGSRYALLAGYGERPGWTRSPVVPRVSLVVGARRPPLNATEIAALVLGAIDPQALVDANGVQGDEALAVVSTSRLPTTRATLAGMGWPDGFDVALGHSGTPGAQAIADQLADAGIRAVLVTLAPEALLDALTDGRVNLALVVWTDEDARAAMAAAVGPERVLDLYTLPITFQAVDGLQLSFTPGGWPLASR